MKKYSISIITVVYNSASLLEATIQSVLSQDYEHIEYIIIDGASKDGTLDIIKKYESQIDTWISEPDKGLYDAMNKGLENATGDFVLFMNSGDHLHESNTMTKVFEQATEDTDILFGEVMMVNDERAYLGTRSERTTRKLPKQLTWKSLKKGMVVSHQAFMPRRSICLPYIENNLCADIDWVIECLKKSRKNVNVNRVVADFLIGGISKQQHQRSLKDRFNVLTKHYGLIPNLLAHAQIVGRAVLKK